MTATVEDLRAVERLIEGLPPDQLAKLKKLPGIAERLEKRWLPNPGPQTDAYNSLADELFYGGRAGPGKTDVLYGLSFEEHKKSLILRRTNKEASRMITRMSEIVGHKNGWNSQQGTFTFADGKIIEFGGCQLEDDKQKYKGDPHDLIGFDEIGDFTESIYRFVIGWNRSAVKGQRCRVVVTGNPPTKAEGYWVKVYWGAWLDPNHPNPAKPGELRWYTTIAGKDNEVDGPGPHLIDGELILARSRTFIPGELKDNPDLEDAGYGAVTAALPEGLREAYHEGRFDIGVDDDKFQVIPTDWIRAAQERWTADGYKGLSMTAMGIDPSGGGKDMTVASARYGTWYAPMITAKGEETADGSAMAGMIMRHRRDGCPIVIDVGGGYAGGMIVRLKDNAIAYHKFDGGGNSTASAQGSGLKFANKRAEAWWRFREALDPDQEGGSPIALPPDSELQADLSAPRYTLERRGITLELKDKIRSRIGRSPDKGDAVVMCLSEGNKAAERRLNSLGRLPKVILGYAKHKRR
jgi:hypothetical protein